MPVQLDLVSTHSLSELALDALTEVGRSLAKADTDPDPVRALGHFLLDTASTTVAGQQVNLVPAGYFQPLEKLFRDHYSVPPETIEQIQAFVKGVGTRLVGFQPASEEQETLEILRSFCYSLHRYLVDELKKEEASVARDWGGDDVGAQASLRAA